MRKISIFILALVCVLCCSMFFVGCGATGGDSTNLQQAKYYLSLDENEITLAEGEEYILSVKKYDSKGSLQQIKSVKYVSDAEMVASVSDGKITANKKGVTYVHVIADGLEVSCFVNVVAPNRNGLVIELTSSVLYKGLQIKANANLYEQGKFVQSLTNVSWTVSDEDCISIDAEGNITPKELGESKKITATATYQGKEYVAELVIDVVEPYYYAFSVQNVKVLTNETLSGKANTKGTEAIVTIDAVNALTGERVNITSDCSVNVMDSTVATAQIVGDKVKVTAKTNSSTLLTARVKGDVVATRITGYTPIATVEDLDELSLKSLNVTDFSALSANYMLTNDIDYAGNLMYPIAPYISSGTTTSIGVQWKYILQATETAGKTTYTYADREKVGTNGVGLTDEQFKKFIENRTISNTISFSGLFDGNGYAIKNASVMYDTGVSNGNETYAVYSSIFGKVTGTIENVAFTGVKQQDPSKCAYDITKLYYIETSNNVYKYDIGDISLTEKVVEKNGTVYSSYMARGCSLIGQATGATIKNVLLEMEFTLLHQQPNLYNGALVALGQEKTIISNCVVEANDQINKTYSDGYYTCGIQGGSGDATNRFENNLALGVFRIDRGIGYDGGNKSRGLNGNWFASANEGTAWSDLFKVTYKKDLLNLRSLTETIATFNTDVWDINSQLSQRPSLKNGCSIKTT